MVFQEPMAALNPVLTVGLQIEESLATHLGLRGRAARDGPRNCWAWSASPMPRTDSDAYRTNFPAACASA